MPNGLPLSRIHHAAFDAYLIGIDRSPDPSRVGKVVSSVVLMNKEKLRIGVLMIGSLYWCKRMHREQWRRERLDMEAKQHVSVPIRYGRRSSGWNCSFTMVFSTKLRGNRLGCGILVPCRSGDLMEEATALWTAETPEGRNPEMRISAGWGCVALLQNSERPIRTELLEQWTRRVSAEPCYGKLNSASGEKVVVDDRGFLNIDWPTTDKGIDLGVDVILATATNPTIVEGRYPPAKEIAAAWREGKGKADGRYFRNNRRCGIKTFQDDKLISHISRANGTKAIIL